LVAESISKETLHFFALNAGTGFCDLNQKISPLSVKKNISDGVGSRNESIDTPLYTPLFFGWTISLNKEETTEKNIM
jgi:hypothetical protein